MTVKPVGILTIFFLSVVFLYNEAYSFEDSVPVGDFPRDIVLDPILKNLYVSNYNSGTISVIDSKNMILKDTIPINNYDSNPTQIVVDSNRHLIFVSDKISGILSVIDGYQNKVTDSINVGNSLWDLDINNNNGKLYVADLLKNQIIIIDTNTMKIIKSLPVNPSPWAVVVNQKTNMVYVASSTSETIEVIDGKNDLLIDKIYSNVKPWGLSINESSNVIYVTSWDSNNISVIDLTTHKKLYDIPITPGAWKMTTNQNSGITVVSNEHSNELYFIDGNSKHFQTMNVSSSPQSLSISPTSDIVYMTNPLNDSISSIFYESENNSQIHTYDDFYDNTHGELILEVADGISKIPQRQEPDFDLISKLLQNIGVTGEFNGNEIANVLMDDYAKQIENEPESVPVPRWTTELATMFGYVPNSQTVNEVSCKDKSFSLIHDIDNADPYEIWVNILPLCALS